MKPELGNQGAYPNEIAGTRPIGERSDAVLRTARGERSDAVLRTAIGERSDAVLRTAIGERSDAVLRTAIGERSDAVLRTAIGERSDAVLRTAKPGDDGGAIASTRRGRQRKTCKELANAGVRIDAHLAPSMVRPPAQCEGVF